MTKLEHRSLLRVNQESLPFFSLRKVVQLFTDDICFFLLSAGLCLHGWTLLEDYNSNLFILPKHHTLPLNLPDETDGRRLGTYVLGEKCERVTSSYGDGSRGNDVNDSTTMFPFGWGMWCVRVRKSFLSSSKIGTSYPKSNTISFADVKFRYSGKT